KTTSETGIPLAPWSRLSIVACQVSGKAVERTTLKTMRRETPENSSFPCQVPSKKDASSAGISTSLTIIADSFLPPSEAGRCSLESETQPAATPNTADTIRTLTIPTLTYELPHFIRHSTPPKNRSKSPTPHTSTQCTAPSPASLSQPDNKK